MGERKAEMSDLAEPTDRPPGLVGAETMDLPKASTAADHDAEA